MTGPLNNRGSWPYVDIVLLTDYRQVKGGSESPGYFLRVHMDVPLQSKDRDEIDSLLKRNKNAEVLERLLKIAPAEPGTPGAATLRAALGQS